PNHDGMITIDEILQAVNNSLVGCAAPQAALSVRDRFTPLNGASTICPAKWSPADDPSRLPMTLAGFDTVRPSHERKRIIAERRGRRPLQLGRAKRPDRGAPRRAT